MTMRKLLEYGGILAGVVLIAFGIGALWLSFDARSTVEDELKQEQIVGSRRHEPGGHPGRDRRSRSETCPLPSATSPSSRSRPVTTRAASRSTCGSTRSSPRGGLTYAQMGRFLAADDPENPAGTSDDAAALTDEEGNPVSNQARNTWVTETALSTALNLSYMAEQLALFGIVVGIALILTGIGFLVLALGGALRHSDATEGASVEKAATA